MDSTVLFVDDLAAVGDDDALAWLALQLATVQVVVAAGAVLVDGLNGVDTGGIVVHEAHADAGAGIAGAVALLISYLIDILLFR